MEDIKTIKVRDLNYASLLKSKGFKLLDTEWRGPLVFWVFENHDDCADKLIQQYINGDATGNIKAFAEAQRTLKQTLNDKY